MGCIAAADARLVADANYFVIRFVRWINHWFAGWDLPRIRWDNIQNGIAGVCGINPRDANYGAGDVYLLRPADGVAGAY
ncbi:hypothetical protein TUM17554_26540 [Klebsiella pneumoniae]|nr:hypothetical protein TUM17554_26540 [Klebsiella pneumoniae]